MLSAKLDPRLREFLIAAEAAGAPPLNALPPVEARAAAAEFMRSLRGESEPVASVEDLRIPGPEDEIPVRVYMPEAAAPRPCVVFFHGGGWVLGGLDTHDAPCSALARRSGAVVVAVDYRLAPEHRFPAAVTDCYAATLWAAANAPRFGADPARLCLCGDSAGGNLAAVVAIKARDEAGPPIALQALVYPVTDLSSFDTPSYREFAEGHFLTAAMMQWFREHYMPTLHDRFHPHASPLLAPDLSGLPPALVITAECDPLRDEGEAFAARLASAGTPATCTRYPGMIHPFFTMPGITPTASAALDEIAYAVRFAARAGVASA